MKVNILRIIAAILSIFLMAGIAFHVSFERKTIDKVTDGIEQPKTPVKEQEVEEQEPYPNEEAADSASAADVDPDADDDIIDELNSRIEVQKELNEYLKEEQGSMNRMASSDDELKKLIQSRILKSYEENVLIAVEIKTLMLESLGVEVPEGFSKGEDEFDDYAGYLKDDIVNSVKDTVATGDARDVLESGISGAIEGYSSGGGLDDVLNGAVSSVRDGVAAAVENKAVEFAESTLDDVTGGIYGVAKGLSESGSPEEYLQSVADEATGGMVTGWENILNYDKTPGVLIEGLSEKADSSADKMKELLNKETMTSHDISDLLYEYESFGSTMDNLSDFGAGVNYEWHENYQNMLSLYRRFIRNETMIEMLESEI